MSREGSHAPPDPRSKPLDGSAGSTLLAVHFPPPTFVRPARFFGGPLFSWSYELLFPQPLCFEKHLRCHGGVPLKTFRRFNMPKQSGPAKNQVFCIHTLADSLSSRKKSSALESATSTLFRENTRGWAWVPPHFLSLAKSRRLREVESKNKELARGCITSRKGNHRGAENPFRSVVEALSYEIRRWHSPGYNHLRGGFVQVV
jgi:hypothetical protein